jgi:membrane-associated protease RseP (regulator of RpoE activity)
VLAAAALTLFFAWHTWPAADVSESVPAPTPGVAQKSDRASELPALRAELRQEIESRERLERDVSRLQARIDILDSQTSGLERGVSARSEAEEAGETQAKAPSRRIAFDSSALLAGGVDRDETAALRELWEDAQLERMYLTDEAEREGWAGTARHRQELRALETTLREELSLEDYDRYLYASGKKNRARVVDVISRSPGALAVFAVGDIILSYDGKRVFNVEEVRKLSSAGRRGDSVSVEVTRGDSTTVLDIPQGPIGLMLMPDSEPPR